MEKLKLLFVLDRLDCGGAEQALFDLLSLLDKDKFSASVFVQEPGGVWEQKFRDMGVEIVYDYSIRKPTWNPVKKLGNLQIKRAVAKARAEECAGLLDACCPGADVVISYSSWIGKEVGFAQNARSVCYIHGDVGTNQVFREQVQERSDQMRRYDRIVCVSQAAHRAFLALTGREAGVEQHYNPINSALVSRKAQEAVSLPEDAPLICAVGRLSSEKGFERLLVAHRRLLDQGIRHHLVLVGDGPDRENLTRLARALEIEDTVRFAGYQSNPYPYMRQSKFLVNASFTEGLPVIAMEAVTLGTPIVATVPSVREAFGQHNCGLITENSTSGLEAGIRRMLTDEAFYAEAKAGACSRSACLDGKHMVKEIEEMFLELCKEK